MGKIVRKNDIRQQCEVYGCRKKSCISIGPEKFKHTNFNVCEEHAKLILEGLQEIYGKVEECNESNEEDGRTTPDNTCEGTALTREMLEKSNRVKELYPLAKELGIPNYAKTSTEELIGEILAESSKRGDK